MINLTPSSEKYLKNLISSKGSDQNMVLRLWVAKGGCAGMEYQMKLTDPNPNDTIINSNGAIISIDAESIS